MAFYGSIGANFYYEGAHKNEKVSVTGYGVLIEEQSATVLLVAI